jgi:hypothetical protein
MGEKRLNTHSVNAGTYRSDGPLSTKNTQKFAYCFILLPLPNKKVVPLPFFMRHDFNFSKKIQEKFYIFCRIFYPCFGFSMRITKIKIEGMINTVKMVETASPPRITLPRPR